MLVAVGCRIALVKKLMSLPLGQISLLRQDKLLLRIDSDPFVATTVLPAALPMWQAVGLHRSLLIIFRSCTGTAMELSI